MTNTEPRPTVQLPVGGEIPEFTIHDRLAKARAHYAKRIGYPITQDEFAELVGCSGATISNYELGNVSRLSKAILREWARVTGVNYAWLVGDGVRPPGLEPGTRWLRANVTAGPWNRRDQRGPRSRAA